MKPTGSTEPVVYILGEAPGKTETQEGEQFVGASGRLLRDKIPGRWKRHLRWNNVVRSRPTMPGGRKDRQPTQIEVECCRPSVVKDIERTKPRAIFGFGGVPLNWVLGQSGIAKWRGRRVPVKVGNHVCWFFPMLHPSYVLRMNNERRHNRGKYGKYGSEYDFVFDLDLQRAFESLDELPDPVVYDSETAQRDVFYVTGAGGDADVVAIERFLKSLYKEKVVGLDYETNGLRPYNDDMKILTVALATKRKSMAFPIDHSGTLFTKSQKLRVRKAYEDFLRDARCRKVVHNLPFELEWTGVKFDRDLLHDSRWGCTQSQAYILDERQSRNKPGCLSLRFLCIQYFGIDIKSLNPVDRADLDNTPLDEVLRYNAVDSKFHRLLYFAQAKRLKAEGLVEQYNHNLRRLPTLVLTQMQGVPISQKRVDEFYDHYTTLLEEIESKLMKKAPVKRFERAKGKAFRPTSNADVLHLVTHIMGLDIEENNEGKKTVDAAVLQKFENSTIKLILEHRGASKMLSTYVLPVREGSPHLYQGSMAHPIIGTTATETWRTSSEDPNIQNWPKRKNREIRRQARGSKGTRFVSFDYSGVQARNVAMESLDKALIEAFRHRYDIHTDWMERIYKAFPKWIPGGLSKLSKDDRKLFRHKAKNLFVFPSFFGAQPFSISRTLELPEDVINDVHAEFWDLFKDIYKWHDKIRKHYREYGFVTGLSGFRRRAPISPTQLINAPIQADESLIVMDAMNRLSELQDPRFQACLMVHDDLTFVWPAEEVEANAEIVLTNMLQTSFDWARVVPLGVEMQVGEDWAEQDVVGEFFSDTWTGSLS